MTERTKDSDDTLARARRSPPFRVLLVQRAVVTFKMFAAAREDKELEHFTATNVEYLVNTVLGPATEAGFPTDVWSASRVRSLMGAYFERPVSNVEMLTLLHACGFGFTAAGGPKSVLVPFERVDAPIAEQPYYESESFQDAASAMFRSIASKFIPSSLNRKASAAATMALVRVMGAELGRALAASGDTSTQTVEDLANILKVSLMDALAEAQRAELEAASSRAQDAAESGEAAWPDAADQESFDTKRMPRVGRKYAKERNAEFLRRLDEFERGTPLPVGPAGAPGDVTPEAPGAE